MRIKATLATLALTAAFLGTGVAAHAAGQTISGEGSSFAGGILTECIIDYNGDDTANAAGDVVSYVGNSSGTGRASFAAGTKAFGAADAGYATTDTKPSDLLYVPLVGGPVAIAYNLPGIPSGLKLNAEVLGQILRGSITSWANAQIKALNPSISLPSANIIVNYRSGSSGTTQNMVNWLIANGASNWTSSGTWATATGIATPVGNSEASSTTMVTDVRTKKYSIGYADLKDTNGKGLTMASIKNADGYYVQPTAAGSAQFLAQQSPQADGQINFAYTTKFAKSKVKSVAAIAKTNYSLSLVTYGLAHASAGADNTAVRKFFTYVLNNCAPRLAGELKYVALTGGLKTKALSLVAKVG
jgi:phosphate transport system substrate-binding protein